MKMLSLISYSKMVDFAFCLLRHTADCFLLLVNNCKLYVNIALRKPTLNWWAKRRLINKNNLQKYNSSA